MPRKLQYRACCLVCYTTQLTAPTTKKSAEIAAGSHVNAYGHTCVILEIDKQAEVSQ